MHVLWPNFHLPSKERLSYDLWPHGEEKPILHCFQCSNTFECIHDQEEHWCEQRKLPRIGNPHTNEVTLWTQPDRVAIVGDFYEVGSLLWNIYYRRVYLLNLPKPSEEKPILHCSDCSEIFECQRDKEKHWCVLSSDLTELEEEQIPGK